MMLGVLEIFSLRDAFNLAPKIGMDYAALIQKYGVVHPPDYYKVYRGPLLVSGSSAEEALQPYLERFDLKFPASPRKKTIGVSDVLVFRHHGRNQAFYCDTQGLVNLPPEISFDRVGIDIGSIDISIPTIPNMRWMATDRILINGHINYLLEAEDSDGIKPRIIVVDASMPPILWNSEFFYQERFAEEKRRQEERRRLERELDENRSRD